MVSAWLGAPCDHCGRKGAILGQLLVAGHRYYLCHAGVDGHRARPDCYHLVTSGAERLGHRLGL